MVTRLVMSMGRWTRQAIDSFIIHADGPFNIYQIQDALMNGMVPKKSVPATREISAYLRKIGGVRFVRREHLRDGSASRSISWYEYVGPKEKKSYGIETKGRLP